MGDRGMPHPHPGDSRKNLAEKLARAEEKCVTIPPEELRKKKLESIERQLHYLIGQVRELKSA